MLKNCTPSFHSISPVIPNKWILLVATAQPYEGQVRGKNNNVHTCCYLKYSKVSANKPGHFFSRIQLSVFRIWIINSWICITFFALCLSPRGRSCIHSYVIHSFICRVPCGSDSFPFRVGFGAGAASIWSPDTGERETRPAPSRARPYAHKRFS